MSDFCKNGTLFVAIGKVVLEESVRDDISSSATPPGGDTWGNVEHEKSCITFELAGAVSLYH